MITLRMLGLASAMLLLLPIGVSALPMMGHGDDDGDDGGSIFEGSQEVVAEVYDVVLAGLPHEKTYEPESLHEQEQLVEGHTVFVVIDLVARAERTNGSVDVMGMVECKANVTYSGREFWGILLPEHVESAQVRCRADEHVVVSPDPFQDPPAARPQRTDRLVPFRIPDGSLGYAEEYSYPVVRQAPDGTEQTLTFYAYKVPIWDQWIDAHGRPKNWYAPLPEDRLREMGVRDFEAYHEKDAPHFR